MDGNVADNSEPGALASMLEVDWAAGPLWGQQELAAVLRHQLAAPLRVDLGDGAACAAEPVGGAAATPPVRPETFYDLLHHPTPPVELLTRAKDFAKACRTDPRSALPKEVAAVIYFVAIAVARRRCGATITRLSPEELRAGIEWVLGQAWVDRTTRRLFDK